MEKLNNCLNDKMDSNIPTIMQNHNLLVYTVDEYDSKLLQKMVWCTAT